MGPPRSAGRRLDQRARVMALTRAAYSVSEGVLPGGGVAPGDEGDDDADGADGAAPTAGGASTRHRRGPARRRLRPRGALAIAVLLALVTAFLVVRATVTASSVVEVPAASAPAEAPVKVPVEVPLEGPAASPSGTEPPVVTESASSAPATPPPATDVVVHVSGMVVGPGVVTLPTGSRVVDAVTAAGGAQPEADLDAVNLARVLVDGEQIHVPAPGEVVDPPPPAPGAGGDVSGSASGPSAPGAPGVAPTGLVNLNTATLAELDALPGVGPAMSSPGLDVFTSGALPAPGLSPRRLNRPRCRRHRAHPWYWPIRRWACTADNRRISPTSTHRPADNDVSPAAISSPIVTFG